MDTITRAERKFCIAAAEWQDVKDAQNFGLEDHLLTMMGYTNRDSIYNLMYRVIPKFHMEKFGDRYQLLWAFCREARLRGYHNESYMMDNVPVRSKVLVAK